MESLRYNRHTRNPVYCQSLQLKKRISKPQSSQTTTQRIITTIKIIQKSKRSLGLSILYDLYKSILSQPTQRLTLKYELMIDYI